MCSTKYHRIWYNTEPLKRRSAKLPNKLRLKRKHKLYCAKTKSYKNKQCLSQRVQVQKRTGRVRQLWDFCTNFCRNCACRSASTRKTSARDPSGKRSSVTTKSSGLRQSFSIAVVRQNSKKEDGLKFILKKALNHLTLAFQTKFPPTQLKAILKYLKKHLHKPDLKWPRSHYTFRWNGSPISRTGGTISVSSFSKKSTSSTLRDGHQAQQRVHARLPRGEVPGRLFRLRYEQNQEHDTPAEQAGGYLGVEKVSTWQFMSIYKMP